VNFCHILHTAMSELRLHRPSVPVGRISWCRPLPETSVLSRSTTRDSRWRGAFTGRMCAGHWYSSIRCINCIGCGCLSFVDVRSGIMYRRHVTRCMVSVNVCRSPQRDLDQYRTSYHIILHTYSLALVCNRTTIPYIYCEV
jgi:hypothetical protein